MTALKKLSICVACIVALPATVCSQTKGFVEGTTRIFGGNERMNTYGLAIGYELVPTYTFSLRANGSRKDSITGNGFVLNHGGYDYEFLVRHVLTAQPKVDVALGLSSPDTADRNRRIFGTYDIGWTEQLCPTTTLRFGAKGILGPDPLAAIGFRLVSRTAKGSQAFAQLYVPTQGDNTRSVTTGQGQRGAIYSLGMEWEDGGTSSQMFYGLALTNALGATTGTSITPALGGQPGIKFTIGFRF